MAPYFTDRWANAHSVHSPGQQARAAVERAREQVAALIGAEDPAQIAFTSGATESNNWVIRSHHGAISPFEHASVRQPALHEGYAVLDNEGWSVTPPASMVPFLSVMAANNETGAVLDLGPLRARSQVLHSDITQAVGKLFVDVGRLDLASFSAHKFGGPKGVGALYSRSGVFPPALMMGGGHEQGARAGTLNVPGIVGMGEAAHIALNEREERAERARELRAIVLDEISGLTDCIELAEGCASPFILAVAFQKLVGETLALDLDHAGYSVSSGAACSSSSIEPSPTLTALGLESAWVRGMVRISFWDGNTPDSARGLGQALLRAVLDKHPHA